MRDDVAALYVDPRGPYPELVVECWDETRDANRYAGPLPVVAHPPCGPWGTLRHMCTRQDGSCGPAAVTAVRAFGGVLEHPACSKLFEACHMPRPGELPDAFGGVTFELQQCDFGHVARKRTWIYVVGATHFPPRPGRRAPTHWVGGSRNRSTRQGSPVPAGIKVCSPRQARRTPIDFARWLLELAASCKANGLEPR